MIHPPHLVFVFQVNLYRFYHGIHHYSTTMMRMNMFFFANHLGKSKIVIALIVIHPSFKQRHPPIGSMYGIFTYEFTIKINQMYPNVGKYTHPMDGMRHGT